MDNHRGLMRSTDPDAIALWDAICTRSENDHVRAMKMLIAMGVKLAHPDDGWVRRNTDGSGSIHPSYPLFDLDPVPGDIIALGAPYATEHTIIKLTESGCPAAFDGYRFVRVTDRTDSIGAFGGNWRVLVFSPTGEFWPPLPPVPKKSKMKKLFKKG